MYKIIFLAVALIVLAGIVPLGMRHYPVIVGG